MALCLQVHENGFNDVATDGAAKCFKLIYDVISVFWDADCEDSSHLLFLTTWSTYCYTKDDSAFTPIKTFATPAIKPFA